MDFVPSMFMPDSTDESGLLFSDSFGLSPLISYLNQDVCNQTADKNGVSNKKRSLCDTHGAREANKGDDDRESKKMKHRDIERQRRLEVSSLFKTLRSLLPFQYIQGKRATADHVFEAVNYIKDLQKKIKELNEKRNRIEKSIPGTVTAHTSTEECTSGLSSSSLSTSSLRCSCVDDKHITVMVMPCLVGIEIIISCCLGRNKSCLSSVLQILAQEERLSVVSCLSTRLQQRFIHTIVSQVGNGIKINISELKDNIVNMTKKED